MHGQQNIKRKSVLLRKVLSVRAMKTSRGNRRTVQFNSILNLDTGRRRMVMFAPRPLKCRTINPLPIEHGAGLAPEPVWSFLG